MATDTLKILRDALEASETGFRQLGLLMLHRDWYLKERQRPRSSKPSDIILETKDLPSNGRPLVTPKGSAWGNSWLNSWPEAANERNQPILGAPGEPEGSRTGWSRGGRSPAARSRGCPGSRPNVTENSAGPPRHRTKEENLRHGGGSCGTRRGDELSPVCQAPGWGVELSPRRRAVQRNGRPGRNGYT